MYIICYRNWSHFFNWNYINLVTQILLKMKLHKVLHKYYYSVYDLKHITEFILFLSVSVWQFRTYIISSFLPDLEFQHPERFFQQRGPFFYLQNNPNFPVHWNEDITWIYSCVNVVHVLTVVIDGVRHARAPQILPLSC